MKARCTKIFGALAGLVGLFVLPSSAPAQSIIDKDGRAPQYAVELEPHLVLSPFWPPRGSADLGVGAGLLVGINVAPRGFLPAVNDSVAISFGIDWVKYFGGATVGGECAEWRGSGNEAVCVRTYATGAGGTYFYSPAVMQWNFYFTSQWSAFGEPGIALFLQNTHLDSTLRLGWTPVFNIGGRYHFSKSTALTMRVGYPYTTIGFSFYL